MQPRYTCSISMKKDIMNTAHWHILLNHLPLIGTVLGALILVAGYAFRHQPVIKQTAMGVLIFSALTAIPAYLTGEGAEELIENMPGVTDSIIETHESAGKLFLAGVLAVGSLAFITLLADVFRRKFAGVLYHLVLVGSIATCLIAMKAGTTGGEIRHTEIRSEAISQNSNTSNQTRGEESDDD